MLRVAKESAILAEPGMEEYRQEIASGKRFDFGRNWAHFLETVDEARILEAECSLRSMLDLEDLEGLSFVDIGSGSGLFSLAARRLGARVHSFDYDAGSVACTRELKRRYRPDDGGWTIEQQSVLDDEYIGKLPKFDVVYSWGVLHHTGSMNQALSNAASLVAPHGRLFIAIYNDQDEMSRLWYRIKALYNSSGLGRAVVLGTMVPYFAVRAALVGVVRFGSPLGAFRSYKNGRGMSMYYDWIDWLGGYPFEVAKPEDILGLHRAKGFELVNLVTTNRLGCNQFVFKKS
jgi:2-polyprenyl-6-hydroxyphenyl methylase/3-demethylubiquinone-9 3-methyltransferase